MTPNDGGHTVGVARSRQEGPHSFAPGHMDDDQRPWSVHDGCFFTEHVRRAAGQYAPNEKTRAANADANANGGTSFTRPRPHSVGWLPLLRERGLRTKGGLLMRRGARICPPPRLCARSG